MAKVDPPPPEDEMNQRRGPKFIIDPDDVSLKDDARVRIWAHGTISKHEHRFNTRVPNRQVVAKGDVKPEEIDVRNLYPFPNLNYIIYRNDQGGQCMWSIMLLSNKKCLFVTTFAKI